METNKNLPLSSRCTHALAKVSIKPTDKSPIWSQTNFVSRKGEASIDIEIQRWLTAEVIERAPGDCTIAFPILSVPKKVGRGMKVDVRLCLDLRRLNPRIPDVEYSLPEIQNNLDSVGSVSGRDMLYTTLEIWDGYLDSKSRKQTECGFPFSGKASTITCVHLHLP